LVPQVYKSYKTKKLDDISYYWQFTFVKLVDMDLTKILCL